MIHLSALLSGIIGSFGYLGIFVLMMLESALIPIPSEATMPLSGFLASQGALLFWPAVLAGTLGNIAGSLASYFLGYELEEHGLRRLIRRFGRFVLIDEDDYDRAERWFAHYGSGVIFVSRLLPAVRTFISLPAGVFRMNRRAFLIYTLAGSFIWSALLTGIGYYLGSKWDELGPVFGKLHYAITAAAVILIAVFVYHKVRKAR